jgi:hypothetical protein
MCDMASATYALMAAGTAAKYQAASQSNSAMQGVQTMEAERQKKLRSEADAALTKGINQSGVVEANTEIENQKAQRVLNLEKSVKDQGGSVGLQGIGDSLNNLGESGQNKLVQTEASSNRSQNNAQSHATARAMASMGGFGDMLMNTGIRNTRGMQEQGKLGNFMQGSAGVADIENQQASHKGDNMRLLGDVLNTASVVSGGYAAEGTSPFNTAAENAAIRAKNAGLTLTNAVNKVPVAMTGGQVGNLLAKANSFASPYYFTAANPSPMARKRS